MQFCFIFHCLEMGGIQTLMMRMAQWLINQGHRVIIIAAEDGSMRRQLPTSVQVIVDKAWYAMLLKGGRAASNRFLQTFLARQHVDVFYCFSDETIWLAAGLLNAQKKPSRCLGGVYGLYDYGIGPAVIGYPKLAELVYPESYLFLHHLPETSRIYMSSALQKHLQSKSDVPVGGRIWPLPVDGSRFSGLRRQPEPGLIVSVGRLAPMKDYNLCMVDVIAELRGQGLDVRWDVYGDGPYRQEMEVRIRTHGLQDYVRLMGEIKYEDLGEAFSRAYLFVGMGTALIEAGFAGIPSIVAIAFEPQSVTYGFLHELPEYTCGEPVSQPVKPMALLIRQVCALSSSGYEQLAKKQRLHAARFDLPHLMGKFLELVEQAPPIARIWRPQWRRPVAMLYRRLRNFRHSHRPEATAV